jgi:hypothetical protein
MQPTKNGLGAIAKTVEVAGEDSILNLRPPGHERDSRFSRNCWQNRYL